MKNDSGVAMKDLLSDRTRSFNIRDVDILEGFRSFSRSEVSVDISGAFSQHNISRLKLPLVTAPMPDVTDRHIATVAARHGALGILPATNDPEEQAEHVRAIKKTEGGFIENPFCLNPDDSIKRAIEAEFSNIPIVEKDTKKLVGMFISQKYGEYFYANIQEVSIKDFMETSLERIAVPLDTMQKKGGFNYDRAHHLMQERRMPALAIVGPDQELLQLVTMKDMISKKRLFPSATRDKKGRLCVGAAILEYRTDDNLRRIKLLADAEADVIVIEQAHAWNVDVGFMIKYIKSNYPFIDVVPGNDSVAGAVLYHSLSGADGVKVGQGPGSVCITGSEENVGLWRPQLSAVYECASTAHQKLLPCTADGGIGSAYDAFRVLATGASAVMVGRLVAQTKDSPAKEIEAGKKLYRAMGSPELVKNYATAFQKYDPRTFIPEGRSEVLPITTSFEEFLKNFGTTLKRIFERFGAHNLADLHIKLRSGEVRAQFAHNRSNR